MKFLLRSLIVLAVAIGLGFALYYAVQALPNGSPRVTPPNAQIEQENGQRPETSEIRPERREGDRRRGFSLRSLVGLAGRVMLFSGLVFGAVIGKNILFGLGKKPNGRKTDGG